MKWAELLWKPELQLGSSGPSLGKRGELKGAAITPLDFRFSEEQESWRLGAPFPVLRGTVTAASAVLMPVNFLFLGDARLWGSLWPRNFHITVSEKGLWNWGLQVPWARSLGCSALRAILSQ